MNLVVKRTTKQRRVLDFDCEARPLGWLGGDWVHKEVTAIASAWIVDGKPQDLEVWHITKRADSHKSMLRKFRERYAEADMVTGHYIRGYDLPLLAGAMMEYDLEPLTDMLTHDTKNDLITHNGISKSQENLGILLGLDSPKVQMDVPKWREANRLTQEGLRLVRERAGGDVEQHIELREALLRRGLLGPPKIWYPGGSQDGEYTP